MARNADRMQTPMTAAGYSGTPLARKLGFKASTRALVVDAPPEFASLLEPLPEASSSRRDRGLGSTSRTSLSPVAKISPCTCATCARH